MLRRRGDGSKLAALRGAVGQSGGGARECGAIGAAGIAIPPIFLWVTSLICPFVVQSEHVRRVAVHVFPRARSGNGNRQTQNASEPRLRVPVLVERFLPRAGNERKRPKRHKRTEIIAAAPGAREVPRLDLLEGPFLRTWAFHE